MCRTHWILVRKKNEDKIIIAPLNEHLDPDLTILQWKYMHIQTYMYVYICVYIYLCNYISYMIIMMILSILIPSKQDFLWWFRLRVYLILSVGICWMSGLDTLALRSVKFFCKSLGSKYFWLTSYMFSSCNYSALLL